MASRLFSVELRAALKRALPLWLLDYRRGFLPKDGVAGIVVTMMLIPQSMAYAIVAGLPAQYGMYASILPLIAYALLGTSMTMAVGPVAVTSLMTASALRALAEPGSSEYIAAAAVLAFLSGTLLLLFGLLRFGFIAKLLSNPVVSGFTSGSSLLILIGQIDPLLGLHSAGGTAMDTLVGTLEGLRNLHWPTALVGAGVMIVLLLARIPPSQSLWLKLVPMLALLLAVAFGSALELHEKFGVAVVGSIAPGLPPLRWPALRGEHIDTLLFPAFTIALINFVSSISVAQALALRRKERINPDAELRALGAANVASAFSAGFPISGGFARSLVNFAAGAQTPLAGVVSALLMALVVNFAGGLFKELPIAVLAATIIVAVAPAIDIAALARAWRYDRADALALAGTALGVLGLGVEAGIAIGVAVSLASLVWRSSNPHIAVLGRVPFTTHFRNVLRYKTETLAHVLALRIDENLLFANAQAVEQRVRDEINQRPQIEHVLLVLSSVSQIDATALEMLQELNRALAARNIRLHFSEVKGPVLDRLHHSSLPDELSGKIFLSTHLAFLELGGAVEDYTI